MAYRPEQLFISRETKSRLHKVLRIGKAQAEAVLPGSLPQDLCGVEGRIMTVDELAENLLTKIIRVEYPEVFELEQALKDTEKRFTDQRAAIEKELKDAEEKFLAAQSKKAPKRK